MGERFQIPWPLWRVQFHLLGGARRMVGLASIYTVFALVTIFSVRRLMKSEPLPVVIDWLVTALTAIQLFVVFAGGCNAIHRATLRDFATKMSESHRLTPLSNLTVALGYLFGSTMQVELLFVINVLIGLGLMLVGGGSIAPWLYGNCFIFSGGVMLWSLMIFSGVGAKKPISPGGLLLGASMLASPTAAFLPGAALFLGAYSVILGFWSLSGSVTVTIGTLAMVGGVSLLLAAFWLYAAAAKYRRPDLPALNAGRGLLLLALWLALSSGGVVVFEWVIRTQMVSFADDSTARTQWIAMLYASLAVGVIAVSGSVKARLLIESGTSPRNWTDRVSDITTAIVAALLIAFVPAIVGFAAWSDFGLSPTLFPGLTAFPLNWPGDSTVLACVLAMLTARAVLIMAHRTSRSASMIVGVFVLFAWVAPPTVDFFRAQLTLSGRGELDYTWLMACSPAGVFSAVWTPMQISIWPGLGVQLAVLLVLSWTAKRTARERAGNDANQRSLGAVAIVDEVLH
jgi:hypothetical protein